MICSQKYDTVQYQHRARSLFVRVRCEIPVKISRIYDKKLTGTCYAEWLMVVASASGQLRRRRDVRRTG